jgi:glycosyltransferase involved in cell wall biosynthesis
MDRARARFAGDGQPLSVRILFVTSAYPAADDDPRGIFIHRLARALVRHGEQVTVLAPGGPRAPSRDRRDGVDVIRQTYWIPRWQTLTRGLAGIVPNLQHRPWLAVQVLPLVVALACRAMVEARRHDVVHAHWIYPAGVAGVAAARWAHRPLVITSHGGDVNLAANVGPLRALCRAVSRAAAACISVSEASAQAFNALGVGGERVAFIPLGVEVDQPQDLAGANLPESLVRFRAARGLRILYLGSLNARKSVHTLVNAQRHLDRAGQRAVTAIVGDGPSAREIEAAIRESGSPNFLMAGSQPPDLVPAWLASADVLALPSISEGRPTVIIEAMASRVPVVATDIPGTRELVSHGRTGFLFPVGDDLAMTQRIVELMNDPVLRAAMGREARKQVDAEGLTTDASAGRYRDVYRRVMAEGPR